MTLGPSERRSAGCALLLATTVLLSANALLAATRQVHVFSIDGSINDGVARKVAQAVAYAEKTKAECLLIELNTPGGELEATKAIVKCLTEAEIPVVTYVAPKGARADSAGVFIAYASHVLAMAPGTRIGAAHPVVMGFEPSAQRWEAGYLPRGSGLSSEEILNQKLLEDTVAWVKLLAQERARNVEWVETSVRKSAVLTADEALQQKVVDLLAADQADLLTKLEGRQVVVGGTPTVLRLAGVQVVQPRIRDVTGILLNLWGLAGGVTALLLLAFVGLRGLDTLGVLEVAPATDLWVKRAVFLAGVIWGGLWLYARTRLLGVLALPVVINGIAAFVWLRTLHRPAVQPAKSFWDEKLERGEAWTCPSCGRINPDFVRVCAKCNHKRIPQESHA